MKLFFISKFLSSQRQGVQSLKSIGKVLPIIIEASFSKSSSKCLQIEHFCVENDKEISCFEGTFSKVTLDYYGLG